MRTRPTILFYSPDGCPVPTLVRQWASANSFPLLVFSRPDEVESIVLRGHPCMLFVDGNGARHEGVGLVRRLKSDAFTAIVPVTALAGLQNADGSWGSFGPDFATAQAIQGLERQWLPVARATAPSCATTGTTPGSTPGTTTAAVPATAVTGTLAFTG